jgi:hypothetical protein
MVPANRGGFETSIQKGNHKKGEVQGQTRQHARLLHLLGVEQVSLLFLFFFEHIFSESFLSFRLSAVLTKWTTNLLVTKKKDILKSKEKSLKCLPKLGNHFLFRGGAWKKPSTCNFCFVSGGVSGTIKPKKLGEVC